MRRRSRAAGSACSASRWCVFSWPRSATKTQLATVALAARFDQLIAVVAGTTLGMMIADVPAVLLGNFAADRIPFKLVRILAAALFAVLGVLAIGSALSVSL